MKIQHILIFSTILLVVYCPPKPTCNLSCLTCISSKSTDCTSCPSGTYLQTRSVSSSCLTTCPIGLFPDPSDNTCKCDISCLTCAGLSRTDCTSCPSGTYFQTTSVTSSCLTTCPIGLFPDPSDNTCKCDGSCLTCVGLSMTDCTSCPSGTYFQTKSVSSSCLTTCPIGLFPDPSDNTCKCDGSCLTCTGLNSTDCTSCLSGTYLQTTSVSSSCLTTCPIGLFPDPSYNTCKCDGSCLTCAGLSSTDCTSCPPGTYLQKRFVSSSCLTTCQIGLFPDPFDNTCKCDETCQKCTGLSSNDCTSCPPGTFLQKRMASSSCLTTCPIGLFPDPSDNTCKCDASCLTCTGLSSTTCTSCAPGTYLQSKIAPTSSCLATCPIGLFPDPSDNTCNCDGSCLTCAGLSSNDCISCRPGTYLQTRFVSSSCLNKCPLGLFPDPSDNTCKCDGACLTCAGLNSNNCTSCRSGTYLQSKIAPTSSCLATCPIGLFPDPSDNTCNCDRTCHTCSGLSSTDCLTCSTNLYLQSIVGPASCLQNCPERTFQKNNDENFICTPCFSGCFRCFGSLSSECFSCALGEFLDNSTHSCKSCHSSCVECINETSAGCSSCKLGFFIDNKNETETKTSGKCQEIPLPIPILKNYTSPLSYILSFPFPFNYSEIYLTYMLNTTISIDGIDSNCYKFNITQINTTNNFTINLFNVNCSITNYQEMHIYLNPSNQVLLNISNRLGTYNLSINMQYYYYINGETRAMIDKTNNLTESLQNSISSSSSSSTLLAASSSFIFQCFISINSIAFLRYFDIKYPENVAIVFSSELPNPDILPNFEIEERLEDGSLPDSYHNYHKVSIYSLNTIGNMILESCFYGLIGLFVFGSVKKLRKVKIKYFQILLILIYIPFVWNYSMNDIISKYMPFSLYVFLGLRYATLQTSVGILNFCYNIFMGFFTIILFPCMIIYKIKVIHRKIVPTGNNIFKKKEIFEEIKQDFPKIIDKNEKSQKIKNKTPNNINDEYFDSLFKNKIPLNNKKDISTSKDQLINNIDLKLSPFKINENFSPDRIKIKRLKKETNDFSKIPNKEKSTAKNLSPNKKNKDLIKMRPESYRYGVFHKDFKQNSLFVSYFIVWILIKDVLYTLIIVLTFDKPFIGLILLFNLNLLYIISLLLINPFRRKLELFQNLFNEMCVIFAIGCATYIAYMELNGIIDEKLKIKAGWGIVFSNNSIFLGFLMRIIIEFIIKFFLLFKNLFIFLKELCKKKNKVATEIERENTELGIFEEILQMNYILE